jgi:hypothetical protein
MKHALTAGQASDTFGRWQQNDDSKPVTLKGGAGQAPGTAVRKSQSRLHDHLPEPLRRDKQNHDS